MLIDKSIVNKVGVYCIECLIDGRIYIGSSCNIRNRITNHERALNNSYHPNGLLTKAFDEYGSDAFRAFALEYTSDDDQFIREQLYLDTFLYAQEYIASYWTDERFNKFGFNIKPSVSDMRGYRYFGNSYTRSQSQIDKQRASLMARFEEEEFYERMTAFRKTEEFRKKLSESNRNSDKVKKLKVSILVYNRETGYFIEEILGLRECARIYKTHRSNISAILRGDRRFLREFHFRTKISEDFPLQIEPIPQYKDYEKWRKNAGRKCSPIIQIDKNGNIVGEHRSEITAGLYLGNKNIQANINREMKKNHWTYGYYWWRKSDVESLGIDKIRIMIEDHLMSKVYLAYNRFTKLFIEEFESIKGFSERYGVNRSSISNCLSGRSEYAGDFIFKKKTRNYPLKLENF